VAKPITSIQSLPIDPIRQREDYKNELVDSLLERKESIELLIDLIEKLDERGILDLLNGLFGQGDKVMGVVMRELNKPGVSDTLDHLMNLVSMIGKLDTNKLVNLTEHINTGLKMAEEAIDGGKTTSVFDLVLALKDPDVNRAVTTLIAFLKGAGSTQE
jgi:uncharacterized protein YjgD (DUF1641 family)